MNKKCKCFLSTFLAALMLVSILPISAFATPNSNIPKAMLGIAFPVKKKTVYFSF